MTGLETVRLSNAFYRDGFRVLIVLVAMLVPMFGLSMFWNFHLLSSAPDPKYFAVDPAGRLVQAVPVNMPYVNDNQLLSFVSEGITAAYALDARNYRLQIQENSKYFTEAGQEKYIGSFQPLLKLITDETAIVTATPKSAPIVTSRMIGADGVFLWTIQMPINVSILSFGKTSIKGLLVTVTVVRVPLANNPRGVAIDSFVATDN
jgi:hypothetical protein